MSDLSDFIRMEHNPMLRRLRRVVAELGEAKATVDRQREALEAGLAWQEACAIRPNTAVEWSEFPEAQMRAALSVGDGDQP